MHQMRPIEWQENKPVIGMHDINMIICFCNLVEFHDVSSPQEKKHRSCIVEFVFPCVFFLFTHFIFAEWIMNTDDVWFGVKNSINQIFQF